MIVHVLLCCLICDKCPTLPNTMTQCQVLSVHHDIVKAYAKARAYCDGFEGCIETMFVESVEVEP